MTYRHPRSQKSPSIEIIIYKSANSLHWYCRIWTRSNSSYERQMFAKNNSYIGLFAVLSMEGKTTQKISQN